MQLKVSKLEACCLPSRSFSFGVSSFGIAFLRSRVSRVQRIAESNSSQGAQVFLLASPSPTTLLLQPLYQDIFALRTREVNSLLGFNA